MVQPRRLALSRCQLIFGVFVVGVQLTFARALCTVDPFFGLCTVYSEGYSESRFRALRAGMSREEVERVVGQPLGKIPWNQHVPSRDTEMWSYSDRADKTANFWRRWVVFEKGSVVEVINDFWVD
jgi:hypothetical protein